MVISELTSIVKDCWSNLGFAAKVGLLTAGRLAGGLASSLYAQESVSGLKPKDVKPIPSAEEKKEEKKVAKEKEEKSEPEPSGLVSDPDGDPIYGEKKSSKKGETDVLFKLFGTGVFHDRDYMRNDIYGTLVHEFIGSDQAYWKAEFKVINEASRTKSAEFVGTINGLLKHKWTPKIDKNLEYFLSDRHKKKDPECSVGFFLRDMNVGTIERGGSFGGFFESQFFDVFLRPKIKYVKNVILKRYEDPFSHEGVQWDIVDFIKGCELGFKVGEDFGFELSGYASFFNQSIIREDYPYSGSASGMCIYEIKDHEGSYKFLKGSLFWNIDDQLLIKLIGFYANRDQEYTGELRENDGTVLLTYDKHKIFEQRYGLLRAIIPFQGKDAKGPHFFSRLHLKAENTTYEEQYEGQFSLLIQSPKNRFAYLAAKKSMDVSSHEYMETIRQLQHLGHNQSSGFTHEFGVGFLIDRPKQGHEENYPRNAYFTAEYDLYMCTGIGNLKIDTFFQVDTFSGKHPGLLKLAVELFGKGYVSLSYQATFTDGNEFFTRGKATHEISIGTGFGF